MKGNLRISGDLIGFWLRVKLRDLRLAFFDIMRFNTTKKGCTSLIDGEPMKKATATQTREFALRLYLTDLAIKQAEQLR